MTQLKSLKVVEFAEGIAGPFAGGRLADLGASVIKVETVDGDWLRDAYPAMPGGNDSAAFFELNRGKRSLRLGSNLALAADALCTILADADVLILDQPQAVRDAMDLTAMLADRPDLIVVDISAWGPSGPWAGKAGSELTAQATAGYWRYLGTADQPARRLGADVGSIGTGLFAVQAVLASLFWREQSGQGQIVTLSLLNSLLSMKSIHLAAQSDPDAYLGPRIGGPFDPIERGWKTSDRPIFFAFGGSVGATGRAGWEQFVDEMGMGELLSDPRFEKNGKNSTGHGSDAVRLRPVYEDFFAGKTSSELVAAMHKYRANASVYATTAEALDHPQTQALDIVTSVENRQDQTRIRKFPAKFSELEIEMAGNAPRLGEHGQDILLELGVSGEDVANWLAEGAIALAREERTAQ